MQFSFSAAAGAQLQPGCTMAVWKQGSRRWKGALHCLERIKPSQESLARGQDQCQQTDNVVLFCRPWERRWRVVTLLHQKSLLRVSWHLPVLNHFMATWPEKWDVFLGTRTFSTCRVFQSVLNPAWGGSDQQGPALLSPGLHKLN